MRNLKKFLMVLSACALYIGSANAFITPDLQPVDPSSKPELDLTGTPTETATLLNFVKELVIIRQTLVSFTDVTRMKQLSQKYITNMGKTALNNVVNEWQKNRKSKKNKIMSLSRTIEDCQELEITDDKGQTRVVDIHDANMVKKAFDKLFFQYPSDNDRIKYSYTQKGEQMKIDTAVEMFIITKEMQKKLYGEERKIQEEWYCGGAKGDGGKGKDKSQDECKKKISQDGLIVLPEKGDKKFEEKLKQIPIERLGIITQLRLYERCLSGDEFCDYINTSSCVGKKDVGKERSGSTTKVTTGSSNEDMVCYWNSAIKAETLYDTVMRYNQFLVAMWTRYRVVKGISDIGKIKEYKKKKDENDSALPGVTMLEQENTVVAQKITADATFADLDKFEGLTDREKEYLEREMKQYKDELENPSNEMSGNFERADGIPGYENVISKKEKNFVDLQLIAAAQEDLQRAETIHNILRQLPSYLEQYKNHKYIRRLHNINRKTLTRSGQCVNTMLSSHYLYPYNAWFGKKRGCTIAMKGNNPTGRVICRNVNITPLKKTGYDVVNYIGKDLPEEEEEIKNKKNEIWEVSCPDGGGSCYSLYVDDYMAILDEVDESSSEGEETSSEEPDDYFKNSRYEKPLEMREKGGLMQYLVDYYRAAIDGNAIYDYDKETNVTVESTSEHEESIIRKEFEEDAAKSNAERGGELDFDAYSERFDAVREDGDYANHVNISADEDMKVDETKTTGAKYLDINKMLLNKDCDPTKEDCELQTTEDENAEGTEEDSKEFKLVSRGPNDEMDEEVSTVDVVIRDDEYDQDSEEGRQRTEQAKNQEGTTDSMADSKDEDASDGMTEDSQEENLMRWVIGTDVMNIVEMDLERGIDPTKRDSSKHMIHIDGTIGKDTIKGGFPVWRDYKVFYDEYINIKYKNIKDYIETIPDKVLLYSIAISLGLESLEWNEEEEEEGAEESTDGTETPGGTETPNVTPENPENHENPEDPENPKEEKVVKTPQELLDEYFAEENAMIYGMIEEQEKTYKDIKQTYIYNKERRENGDLTDLEIEELDKKDKEAINEQNCDDDLDLGTCSDISIYENMGRNELVDRKNKLSTKLSAFNNAYNKYYSDIREAELVQEVSGDGIEYNKELYTKADRRDLMEGKLPENDIDYTDRTDYDPEEDNCYGNSAGKRVCADQLKGKENFFDAMPQAGDLNEEEELSQKKNEHAVKQKECYLNKAKLCEQKLELAKYYIEKIDIALDLERREYAKQMSNHEADFANDEKAMAAAIHKFRADYDSNNDTIYKVISKAMNMDFTADTLREAREQAVEIFNRVFYSDPEPDGEKYKLPRIKLTNTIRDLQKSWLIYSPYYYNHRPDYNEKSGEWGTFLIDLDNIMRLKLTSLPILGGANMFAGVYETAPRTDRDGEKLALTSEFYFGDGSDEYTKPSERYFLGLVGVKDDFLAPYSPMDSAKNGDKAEDYTVNLPVREAIYFDVYDFSNLYKHYMGDGESRIGENTDVYISRRQFLADYLGCSIYDDVEVADDYVECAKKHEMEYKLESVPEVWRHILAPRTFVQREFNLRKLVGVQNGGAAESGGTKEEGQVAKGNKQAAVRAGVFPCRSKEYDLFGNPTKRTYLDKDGNSLGFPIYYVIDINDRWDYSVSHITPGDVKSDQRLVFRFASNHPDWMTYAQRNPIENDEDHPENDLTDQEWIESLPECEIYEARVNLNDKGDVVPYSEGDDNGYFIFDRETGALFDDDDLNFGNGNGIDGDYNFAKNASELGHILTYYREGPYQEETDELKCEVKYIQCMRKLNRLKASDPEEYDWDDDDMDNICTSDFYAFAYGGKSGQECDKVWNEKNRMRLSINNVMLQALNKGYEHYGDYDKKATDKEHVAQYLAYKGKSCFLRSSKCDEIKEDNGARLETSWQNHFMKMQLINGQLSDFLNQVEVLRISEDNVRKSKKKVAEIQNGIMTSLAEIGIELNEEFDLADEECTTKQERDGDDLIPVSECKYTTYENLRNKLLTMKHDALDAIFKKLNEITIDNITQCQSKDMDSVEECLKCGEGENTDICLRVASLIRQYMAYKMDEESAADKYPEDFILRKENIKTYKREDTGEEIEVKKETVIKYPGDLTAIDGTETEEEMLEKMKQAFADYEIVYDTTVEQDAERENNLKRYKRPFCAIYPYPKNDQHRFLTVDED